MLTQPWRIHLFGGLQVQNGDLLLTRFKTQKIAGLLAYLAYHLPQVHSREVLIDLCWPESAPEAGRASLSVALSSLRNQLEPPGTPANAVLRADRFSISLNPQTVTTDVADFEAAIKAAARAGSDVERTQSLERAVGLYRGSLLPGLYEEWIAPEETRLAGLFFDTVSALITHLEEAGRSTEALRYARQAVSVDPLREEAHGHLMRLLAATGQPVAALRQYREMERLLDEELGEEPSEPLRALARRIEKELGTSAPAMPPVRSSVSPRTESLPAITVGPARPTTLTFLLTDIEGSAPLREQNGEAFRGALETYHAALRSAFAQHGGQEITEAGASFQVAFSSARAALTCAAAGQQALAQADWPAEIGPLGVRMAVHTGDVTLEGGDYHGLARHHVTRMLAAAHGGQILVSEASAALVQCDLGEDLRLSDLGVWRLREVAAPQRLYQLEYPGMSGTEFPAPSAAAGYQPGLPLQGTRFFGREQEIARLVEMLSSVTPSRSRLVTLTGPGGTGKSRLAVAVAERLVKTFQGAVWFVALADLSDPRLIAGTIQDSLRLPRSPLREPLEQVVEALSKQPSLLILDNFEHLLAGPAPEPIQQVPGSAGAHIRTEIENPESDGGVRIVQRLLSRVPTLVLLVTSRQLLGLPGEREYPVPPLPTPHGEASPAQLSLFDSVCLFVDRAQAVLPHFQVTNQNAAAVAELCDRLEGIPLAIELAAARSQVLTPAQMLAQLANRFAFLTSRRRGVEERHRTLRAAVEWSYRLLTPELQRFFCRLSVFRGWLTAEEAEQVCEEPLALDYLTQLSECSLIEVGEDHLSLRPEHVNFWMLATLREYAQERLEVDEQESLLRRFTVHFSRQPFNWGAWGNVERAMMLAIERNYATTALRLCTPMYVPWWAQCRLQEGIEVTESLLARPGAWEPTIERAGALSTLGSLYLAQGAVGKADLLLEEALGIFRHADDRHGITHVLIDLVNLHLLRGDYDRAQSIQIEALNLCRAVNQGVNNCIHGSGRIAWARGNFAEARRLFEESGLPGIDPQWLARIALAEGKPTIALAKIDDYLKNGAWGEQRRAEGQQVRALAMCRIGDPSMALAAMAQCLHKFRSIGMRDAMTLTMAGEVLQAAGRVENAVRLYGAASNWLEAQGTKRPIWQQTEVENAIGSLRKTLSETAFGTAWEAGRAMSWEEAVAYALEESDA